MSQESVLAAISAAAATRNGVCASRAVPVRPDQLTRLVKAQVIERVHPGVYRLTAVPSSAEQMLRAALLWAGADAAARRRSAGAVYGLEGVRAPKPEIIVPRRRRLPSDNGEDSPPPRRQRFHRLRP
jgi:hypothetical protein